nr:S-type anion channel SLAH4-like [Ipomoea batatas]GMD99298.1 S-type anion channel SLAH4-like [Ipomoea batatas]
MLWKTLFPPHHAAFHVLNITLWSLSFVVLIILSALYLLRCLLFFSLVKGEFLHHIGVNYLFAPWISWLLLLQSAPFHSHYSPRVLWWFFAVPVVVLDVKIYGQWFTKGTRILTAVANPTSQLTVISNLVVARAAARIGWQEVSIGCFSLGMIHYLVLFVTLYQRLPGSDRRLPAMLRPVFFLFFAAPSEASLAWDSISGIFDTCSKMLFYLSLFLFTALICRPNLFKKSFKKSMRRFNVALWAYSYTITLLALAASKYAKVVTGAVPRALMFILAGLSILVFLSILFITTFVVIKHASNRHFHKSSKKIFG